MKNRHKTQLIIECIAQSRQFFHILRAAGDKLHAGLAVTSAMRGVLESLDRDGPSTVPRLARSRPVARQHIQRIVDSLLARNLVRLELNPDHKRSSLVALTAEGKRVFALMRQREDRLVGQVGRSVGTEDVATAVMVLAKLKTEFAQMIQSPDLAEQNSQRVAGQRR